MSRVILSPQHPLSAGLTADSRLVRAYRGERSDTTPVWFMRQAGRSLPEYRELRVGTRMLDACLDPAMASEITLQPVRRHRVDAGIFFSDIVVPLKLVGVDVEIQPGRGPVFGRAYADAAGVAELTAIDPARLDEASAPITEAVARTVAELSATDNGSGTPTPLIGFAGAPFTLAAYLAEGGPSKDHLAARTLMHADPGAWRALMEWTAELTGRFLRTQVLAGASAAQLFDSWAGALSLADYETHVAPASARALSFVHDLAYEVADASGSTVTRQVPVVHFGVGTGELLAAMHGIGVDTVGVDYRVPLDVAAARVGGGVPLQGNLDPALLAAPWPVLEAAVRDVLRRGGRRARARLQPRSRRAARDRPDRAHPRGRARARGGRGVSDRPAPQATPAQSAQSAESARSGDLERHAVDTPDTHGVAQESPEPATGSRGTGSRADVVVVGGGVAGLVAALECAKVGLRVTVLERRDELGGCVGRIELDGLTLDSGAESFATRGGSVAELLKTLGLDGDIVDPNPAGAWLVMPGPHGGVDAAPLPKTGMLGIPANPLGDDVRRIIGWSGAVRAYADRLMPILTIGRAHSLGQLVRSRMGAAVLDRLVTPISSGVYSADPNDLDLDVVAPGLNEAMTRAGSLSGGVGQLVEERRAGGAVRGIRGGMHRLVDALVAELARFGVTVITGAEVTGLARLHVEAPVGEADGGAVEEWRVTAKRSGETTTASPPPSNSPRSTSCSLRRPRPRSA